MSRKPLIAGNWKMHKTVAEAELYIQALLLGHHPLGSREMALLNEGLIDLIERGVSPSEEGA